MDTNETTIEPLEGADAPRFDNAPIGVFDSGFGGLTVAREIAKELPRESIVYLGDSARCPYGPRSLDEVDGFVQQIGAWLVERGVKLVVIACNTATAAGLSHAQRTFPVPVIGVVEPGARAAAHATKNRRVGVIATKATVESDAYTKAIRHLDAGITVFSTATPRFVEIAEQGLRMAEGPIEDFTSLVSTVYIRPAFQEIAREYLEPLRRCDIDTLVLGCTHFPLLKALIGGVVGRDVTLISSAQEAAHDVAHILSRRAGLGRLRAELRLLHDGGGRGGIPQLRRARVPYRHRPGGTRRVPFVAQPFKEKELHRMKTIVIASNNAHKAEEIATALAFPGWEFRTLRELGLDSDPAEDADSFEGNARIKAQAARAASGGLAVLADDSGLAVDALDGAPGVHSARYAGEPCDDAANNAKLLAELADVPDEKRTGRFVCTLVFIDEDGTETVARGTIEGRIGREERGRHGFGYDPLFLPDMFEDGRTLAEALPEEKNAVSHRGNALRQLRAKLAQGER